MKILLETRHNHGWYDFSVPLPDAPNWEVRYAGRVETGKWRYSDPVMGGMVG